MQTRQNHWEIKGRFPKRVVLANVPSFRFSFRGNIRRNHPFGKPPFCQHQKGSLGDKRAVSKRVVLANVPSFRFSFQGNIRQNHPFGNHPFANPRQKQNRHSCLKRLKDWELRNIYHHHPESKRRKTLEANCGSIHPYGR